MISRHDVRLGIASAIFTWAGAYGVAAAQQNPPDLLKIAIDDASRPLAEAADIIERTYGWIVTYEDPPFQFAQDTLDVTTSVRRTYTPGQLPVVVPRGGRLIATIDVRAFSMSVRRQQVLEQLLSEYERQLLPGQYRIVADGDRFHLVPTLVRNRAGESFAVESILDTRIRIAPTDGPLLKVVELVRDEVSRAIGKPILIGTIPTSLMVNTRVQIDAQAGTARQILDSVLSRTGSKLSWRLFYGPSRDAYGFNFQVVPDPN